MSRPVTMNDLGAGVRVRHIHWGDIGTIRYAGCRTEICWDDTFGEFEVSTEGPIFPSDLEIIGRRS